MVDETQVHTNATQSIPQWILVCGVGHHQQLILWSSRQVELVTSTQLPKEEPQEGMTLMLKEVKNKGKHLFNAHSDGHLVMHIKYQYCRKCDPNIASSSL